MSKLSCFLSSGERVTTVLRRFLGGVDAAKKSHVASEGIVGSVLSKEEGSAARNVDIEVLASQDPSGEKIWLAARTLRGIRADRVVRFCDEDRDGGTGKGATVAVDADTKF